MIEPKWVPPLPDPAAEIRLALRNPVAGKSLRELAKGRQTVGISICDVTRPFPARVVLPVVLDYLDVDPSRVTIFIATGTHRACRPAEIDRMLGEEIAREVRIVQHDAFDRGRHVRVGTIPGSTVPALVDSEFMAQDLKITTGFIEPHFFAGFSGGPKMVLPGLASIETVLELHSAARIGHPRATWGVIAGNPVQLAIRGVARRVGVDFNLDVTLNRDQAITGVFAGELFASHARGCTFALDAAMVSVPEPFDLVVASNSGYPLDQNLYQTVKGMSAAAQIVRDGGTILIASECSDGRPEHGMYKDLLRQSGGPSEFLEALAAPNFRAHDQWQVQIQAQIQTRARVQMRTDGLDATQLREAWLESVEDISEAVAASGANRVAVLPQGPQTIPYVRRGR